MVGGGGDRKLVWVGWGRKVIFPRARWWEDALRVAPGEARGGVLVVRGVELVGMGGRGGSEVRGDEDRRVGHRHTPQKSPTSTNQTTSRDL